jgi:N-alpha-acetyltransferase 15/16, NatA auxiliary subunit
MAKLENNGLPAKESGLFRQIVKFYETKQYKKGLKAADQVMLAHNLDVE